MGGSFTRGFPTGRTAGCFLASVSFFVTFLAVRLLVVSITHHVGPFGYVEMGGRHIHHLVWGILLLLIAGYATLAEAGQKDEPVSILVSRVLALMYGIGAALTLDEFALWLNLDAMAYWGKENRLSLDAVVLFGALLAIGTWVRRSGSAQRPRRAKRVFESGSFVDVSIVPEQAKSEIQGSFAALRMTKIFGGLSGVDGRPHGVP